MSGREGGRDRPIIFSAPMVRALLDGRKTQTRRLMPNQTELVQAYAPMISGKRILNYAGEEIISEARYAVGDQLWVREACRAEELSRPPLKRPATKREQNTLKRTVVVDLNELDGADGVRYLADDTWLKIENTRQAGDAWSEMFHYGQGRGTGPRTGRQVPSIHMPRWASRLTLTVTDVRVQRLEDISEEDARAEGVGASGPYPGHEHDYNAPPCMGAVDNFEALWNTLHGPDAWSANPWVVALTFTVERRNIDHLHPKDQADER